MKHVFFALIALMVLGTSCGKKKAEREAEALRKEEARQQGIYESQQQSLGALYEDWVQYYLGKEGLASGEMHIYVFAKGQNVDFNYQDTLRTGKVVLPRLVVPKFPPANATMINGNTIEKCDTPWQKYLVEAEAIPNPAPVPLVLELDDASLLLGGYIIAHDLGWGWFYFDIPGTLYELSWLADSKDTFLFADENAPGSCIRIYAYDGNAKGELKARFLVKTDKSFIKR